MHKTIYIEPDEEITSIIGRIRQENVSDVFLVVPSNAMLVQGIINLKLLKREADKIGKNVILITNDKYAKKVIKKIGFEIRENVEPDEDEMFSLKNGENFERASFEAVQEINNQENIQSGKREIGTSSFFVERGADFFEDENLKNSKNDLSPEEFSEPDRFIKKMDMTKNREKEKNQNNFPFFKKEERSSGFQQRKRETEEIFKDNVDYDSDIFKKRFDNEKAEKFFGKYSDSDKKEVEKNENQLIKNSRGKGRFFLFSFSLFFLLLILGVGGWVYFNWPQMEVVVYPKEKSLSANLEIEVLTDVDVSDFNENVLAGEFEEAEISKTVEFPATGEKYSSDAGKAFGKVKIYNKYSSSSQSLVATTRVLSKEGKLFRLVDSVTVPGMKDEIPGEIEVKVVADKPGKDYNIEASTFTIEGFKGNPKYDKFEVVSSEPMTGGADSSDNELVKYVTENDLEKARVATLDELEKIFEEDLAKKIKQNGFVSTSVKKEIIENKSSFDAGDVAEKFNYTVKQKISLITFDKNDFNQLVENGLKNKLDSGYELDGSKISTEITKDIFDFENKKMSLGIEISGIAWPQIDQENFKKDLAGKKVIDQDILKDYQEIKKIDIKYVPGWMSGGAVSEKKIKIDEKREIF